MNPNDIPKMLKHINRKLFQKAPMAYPHNMASKHIIITGATPGSIGFETAKTLATWGARITITCRNNTHNTVTKLKETLKPTGKQLYIQGHDLDITQPQSVNTFADWYQHQQSDSLDILINNAGIHLDLLSQWQQPKLTSDGFEIHWRTNYLGTYHLTNALLPLLKNAGTKNGDARIINVVSHLHSRGKNYELFYNTTPYDSWQAYSNSKLAAVHHAFALQHHFSKDYNLQGYALHPGAIFTNIANKGLDGNALLQKIRNFFAPLEALFLLTPEQGAQTSIYCATTPELTGGNYYERCALGELNPEARDLDTTLKLWQETEAWCNSLAPTTNEKNSEPHHA